MQYCKNIFKKIRIKTKILSFYSLLLNCELFGFCWGIKTNIFFLNDKPLQRLIPTWHVRLIWMQRDKKNKKKGRRDWCKLDSEELSPEKKRKRKETTGTNRLELDFFWGLRSIWTLSARWNSFAVSECKSCAYLYLFLCACMCLIEFLFFCPLNVFKTAYLLVELNVVLVFNQSFKQTRLHRISNQQINKA